VSRARVTVDGVETGAIGRGLFVLVGLRDGDGPEDLEYVVSKVERLRIFDDAAGKMNLAVREAGGSLLVVSEFTLYGDTRRGNRPSWIAAMPVEAARAFWPSVEARFAATGLPCAWGRFQAMMDCDIVNDGPVTLLVDSSER
jgi:D-tyrosyl-tRNA(Tyr) deacylase